MVGTDYHIHTHYCGCANETMTIPAILERCKAAGRTSIAITDHRDNVADKMKMTQRRKAIVYPEDCTGCIYCKWVCPENAIAMIPSSRPGDFYDIAFVDQKKCTGCGLCEEQCIKSAIVIPGHEFPSDIPTAFQLGAVASK